MAAIRRAGGRVTTPDKLAIGHVQSATGARQAAFACAETVTAQWTGDSWAVAEGARLGIDLALIARKQRFEQAYETFLFLELMARYVAEHPDDTHELEVGSAWWTPYESRCRAGVSAVRVRRQWAGVRFVAGLCLLPLVVLYHRLRSRSAGPLRFERNIVCAVDGEQTVAMFQELFGDDSRLRFVVEPAYVAAFSAERRAQLGIEVLGLGASDARVALRCSFAMAASAWRYRRALASEGGNVLLLWHSLLQGRALAIHGGGNVFVTFEHLIHMRAVRNEFLRREGSASVFVPKNSYVTYRHYPAEAWQNYDVIGCAGPHAEALYRWKHSVTRRFASLGSFDAHAPVAATDASYDRRKVLEDFARGYTVVTVLSPGICDENLSSEVRLMALARALSLYPGLRVVVRPKPVAPVPKYAAFYEDHLAGAQDVLVAAPDVLLSEHQPSTALFVTSVSTSACDLALRGSDVLFVDFMQTPDLYLPWLEVPEVVTDEASAIDRIVAWTTDRADGPVRREHRRAMERLRTCLGYTWPDFATYRRQVQACVESLS